MLKRLASTAALAIGLTTLAASPAAADCNVLSSLLSACTAAPPAAAPAPAPAPQPQAAPQPAPPPAPVPTPVPAQVLREVPDAADRLYRLMNEERARAGLPGFELRAQISAVSSGHSTAMAVRRDIWHNAGYFSASTRRALGARALGENVALNRSIDDAHARLMASAGHRANILHRAFDAVGVSVVQDESGTLYVTENFVDSAGPVVKARATKAKATKAKATKARASRVRRARR